MSKPIIIERMIQVAPFQFVNSAYLEGRPMKQVEEKVLDSNALELARIAKQIQEYNELYPLGTGPDWKEA